MSQNCNCKKGSDWLKGVWKSRAIFKSKAFRGKSIMNIRKTNHIY